MAKNKIPSQPSTSNTVGRPGFTKDAEDFSPIKVVFETINKKPTPPPPPKNKGKV